jgi:hypothetical protein
MAYKHMGCSDMPFQKGNQLAKGHNGGLRKDLTVELITQLGAALWLSTTWVYGTCLFRKVQLAKGHNGGIEGKRRQSLPVPVFAPTGIWV